MPDLVSHLSNGEKVLVEIANPRDPKRFLGEIVCPQFLFYDKEITRGIIFVLHDKKQQEIHDRGFIQDIMLKQIFRNLYPIIIASWNETTAYHNLKYLLEHNPPSEGVYSKKHE